MLYLGLRLPICKKMKQPPFSILLAPDWLIFCIKLLLSNLNEEGCCRAAELWPSEYICRTQIWLSCERSAFVCHLSIQQTLYKHVVWQSSPQSLLQFRFQCSWWCSLCSSIFIHHGSCFRKCFNSNTLDVFWLFSGTSQMNCYVEECPDFSCSETGFHLNPVSKIRKKWGISDHTEALNKNVTIHEVWGHLWHSLNHNGPFWMCLQI